MNKKDKTEQAQAEPVEKKENAEPVEKKENAEPVEKKDGGNKQETDGTEQRKDDNSQFEEKLNKLLFAIEERDKRLEKLEKVLSEQKDLIANKTAKEKLDEIHSRPTESTGYYDFSTKSMKFNNDAGAASYNKSKEYYDVLGITEFYRKTRIN